MKKNVKISEAYKFFATMVNIIGKAEKAIALAALGATSLKFLCTIGMDVTKKNFKN